MKCCHRHSPVSCIKSTSVNSAWGRLVAKKCCKQQTARIKRHVDASSTTNMEEVEDTIFYCFIYLLSFFFVVVWILDTALLDVSHPLLFAAGVYLLVRYNTSPAGHRSGCPATGPPPSLLAVLNEPRDTAVATAEVVDVFTRATTYELCCWLFVLQTNCEKNISNICETTTEHQLWWLMVH